MRVCVPALQAARAHGERADPELDVADLGRGKERAGEEGDGGEDVALELLHLRRRVRRRARRKQASMQAKGGRGTEGATHQDGLHDCYLVARGRGVVARERAVGERGGEVQRRAVRGGGLAAAEGERERRGGREALRRLQLRAVEHAAGEVPLVGGRGRERAAAGGDEEEGGGRGGIRTRMSLLSSPTLPKRYVLPSQRASSNATAETKDEWPWQRAMTRCSHGEKMFTRSSCPPVFFNPGGNAGVG